MKSFNQNNHRQHASMYYELRKVLRKTKVYTETNYLIELAKNDTC